MNYKQLLLTTTTLTLVPVLHGQLVLTSEGTGAPYSPEINLPLLEASLDMVLGIQARAGDGAKKAENELKIFDLVRDSNGFWQEATTGIAQTHYDWGQVAHPFTIAYTPGQGVAFTVGTETTLVRADDFGDFNSLFIFVANGRGGDNEALISNFSYNNALVGDGTFGLAAGSTGPAWWGQFSGLDAEGGFSLTGDLTLFGGGRSDPAITFKFYNHDSTPTMTPVPEPSVYLPAMVLIGLGLIYGRRRMVFARKQG